MKEFDSAPEGFRHAPGGAPYLLHGEAGKSARKARFDPFGRAIASFV
jgi:hypothetical protein